MSQHHAQFTWGAGPNSVHIAGNFNNWSDSATPLKKLEDGTFAADIPLPWGEKQAFKYVVDGEWKVREDEAKEWDAAGNMNNVYTAPHAPAPTETAQPAQEAAPAAPAAAVAASEPKAETTEKSVPAETAAPSVAPAAAAEVPASEAAAPQSATEPTTLLASSAPKAASSGSAPVLGAPVLGAPVAGSVPAGNASAVPGSALSKGAEPVIATAAVPIEAAPATTDPTPVKIEQAAANANIGQAPTAHDEATLQEKVAEYGAGALGALGAAVGGAVVAVEKLTGVDLGHGNPLTVEEAKAQGIDVKSLPQTDVEAHAASPVGTKPPISAVEALEEKTKELKVSENDKQAAVPLPNGDKSSYAHAPKPLPTSEEIHSKHDLPAQNEQADKHQVVPAPVITPVAPKDPKKDRSLDAPLNKDTAGTKPIDANPAISAVDAKKEAEAHPGVTGSTSAAAQGKVTPTSTTLNPGETVARPDAPSANNHLASPPTPAKEPVVPVAPATPAKDVHSTTSTPASTPAKSTHAKEATGNSDIRKRKSSFFTKIKHAFSPKDKEKK